tara:strand:- start:10086 stop:10283 length:198 start_codon:yes stop_codon:yes gene_type:complete
MIYLILIFTLFNSAFLIYFFYYQRDFNKKILNKIFEGKEETESITKENKKHIDDMLKMREMYESD